MYTIRVYTSGKEPGKSAKQRRWPFPLYSICCLLSGFLHNGLNFFSFSKNLKLGSLNFLTLNILNTKHLFIYIIVLFLLLLYKDVARVSNEVYLKMVFISQRVFELSIGIFSLNWNNMRSRWVKCIKSFVVTLFLYTFPSQFLLFIKKIAHTLPKWFGHLRIWPTWGGFHKLIYALRQAFTLCADTFTP